MYLVIISVALYKYCRWHFQCRQLQSTVHMGPSIVLPPMKRFCVEEESTKQTLIQAKPLPVYQQNNWKGLMVDWRMLLICLLQQQQQPVRIRRMVLMRLTIRAFLIWLKICLTFTCRWVMCSVVQSAAGRSRANITWHSLNTWKSATESFGKGRSDCGWAEMLRFSFIVPLINKIFKGRENIEDGSNYFWREVTLLECFFVAMWLDAGHQWLP